MRQIILGSIIGCAATLLALALLMVSRGARANPPGTWERRLVDTAKHQLLVGDKSTRNPLPVSADNIREGRENFAHYCFVCHGLDGQGTGVPFFDGISPPIPPLGSKSVQAYTDGQLFWVIRNGLWPSGMPAARGILNDDEIWSMVIYIRNLPPAGSLGEPPAYTGDCREPAPTAVGQGAEASHPLLRLGRYLLPRLPIDRRAPNVYRGGGRLSD
jgi:S-disulfanyl-L-cysteine oxidoreductase SoxD